MKKYTLAQSIIAPSYGVLCGTKVPPGCYFGISNTTITIPQGIATSVRFTHERARELIEVSAFDENFCTVVGDHRPDVAALGDDEFKLIEEYRRASLP